MKCFGGFKGVILGLLIIAFLFFLMTLVPGSGRWSAGHYLLITEQKGDTIAYALNGENIITTPYRAYLVLLDKISIKKSDVVVEYHSEGVESKGWIDADFLYDYLYNYCVYMKRLGPNFVVLEDNEFDIGKNCSTDITDYIELQEIDENIERGFRSEFD